MPPLWAPAIANWKIFGPTPHLQAAFPVACAMVRACPVFRQLNRLLTPVFFWAGIVRCEWPWLITSRASGVRDR